MNTTSSFSPKPALLYKCNIRNVKPVFTKLFTISHPCSKKPWTFKQKELVLCSPRQSIQKPSRRLLPIFPNWSIPTLFFSAWEYTQHPTRTFASQYSSACTAATASKEVDVCHAECWTSLAALSCQWTPSRVKNPALVKTNKQKELGTKKPAFKCI